jgi:hypothetical protein
MMSTPVFSSPRTFLVTASSAARARIGATPPPGNDAFFDGRATRVQRVLDAGLLLLHLGLGRGADVDLGDPAGQLGQALLEFLAVVVAGGAFDLVLDLLDAALDVFALPAPSMMVVFSLSMRTFLAAPRSLTVMFSSFDPEVLEDRLGRR